VLAMPWRFAARAVATGCNRVAGKGQPLGLMGIVAAVAVTVALAHGVQQGQWAVVIVVSGLAVCAIAYPIADAYVARGSEYAADRFAAGRGAARDLAAALDLLAWAEPVLRGTARLLGRHPAIERRLDALAARGY
jgi:Zn-dependent protease with chaperone function